MNRATRSFAVLAGLALLTAAGVLIAGPLDPPAGPIVPTYKTLAEVEPRIAVNATNTPGDADSLFKITQPGSYYLTGSITGVPGKNGIKIEADGVTLDLNGMDVTGVAGALFGIRGDGSIATSIVNGSVSMWPQDGIVAGESAHIERIRAFANLRGINVDVHSVVSDCVARDNQSTGIRINGPSTISHCTVTGTVIGSGIHVSFAGTVTGCTAYDNNDAGIDAGTLSTITNCTVMNSGSVGIRATTNCTIATCTVSSSPSGHGISVTRGNTISGCTVTGSSSNGINTGDDCTVTGCSSTSNSAGGIVVGANCSVIDCDASGNSGSGITTGSNGAVTNCTTSDNRTAAGINVGTGSSVSGCTSTINRGDGIVASSNCQVRGNTCTGNGVNPGVGAGVNCTGNLNRVEDNVCTGADYGIFVNGNRNFIARNTCGSNTITNWQMAAGNVALIVNAVTGGAISGNTGGVAPGSTDPNANFTY